MAIFNLDGNYYAVEDVCTHDGGTLTGALSRPAYLPPSRCPFSIKTGAVLAPPAYEPIHVFPVRVQDGCVQIRDDRWE